MNVRDPMPPLHAETAPASMDGRAMAVQRKYRELVAQRHGELAQSPGCFLSAGRLCFVLVLAGVAIAVFAEGEAVAVGVILTAFAAFFGTSRVYESLAFAKKAKPHASKAAALRTELPQFFGSLAREMGQAGAVETARDSPLRDTIWFLDQYFWGPVPTLCLAPLGLANETRWKVEGTISGRPALVVVVEGDPQLPTEPKRFEHPQEAHLFGFVATGETVHASPTHRLVGDYEVFTSPSGVALTMRLTGRLPEPHLLLQDLSELAGPAPASPPVWPEVTPVQAPRLKTPVAAGDAFFRALGQEDFVTALALADPELNFGQKLELTADGLRRFFDHHQLRPIRWAWSRSVCSMINFSEQRWVALVVPAGENEESTLSVEIQLRCRGGVWRVGYLSCGRCTLGYEHEHS